jgi:hypothetical protein
VARGLQVVNDLRVRDADVTRLGYGVNEFGDVIARQLLLEMMWKKAVGSETERWPMV